MVLVTQKVLAVVPGDITGPLAQFPHISGPKMADTVGETTLSSPTTGAGAQNPNERQSPETDAARGSTQGAAEY